MADFSTLESIFGMMQPLDISAAKKVGTGQGKELDLSTFLIKLILESGKAGCYNVSDLKQKLENYRLQVKGDDTGRKKFDFFVNFYSTVNGGLTGVEYPYICPSPNNTKDKNNPVVRTDNLDVIMGITPENRADRQMSLLLSHTPYVTPMVRDAQKSEIFINFIPSTVISRCVPYLELEFSFDRKVEESDSPTSLRTAGLLKFLLGGESLDASSPTDPNAIMFSARAWKDDKNPGSIISTAGMELFTSPQTLVNLDPIKEGSRYVGVKDPTRPFASLESVSINVTSQPGVYSYKKATAVIKLHDRSRLSELADLIQPTTYTATSVWLTYGWRHPYEPSPDSKTKTYADFINNNMLVKEAYGLKNVSFSFDPQGQVSITMELYTKSISEMRDVKINKGPFNKIAEDIKEIAKKIHELRVKYKLESPSTGGVEVRAYSVLDAAENGDFPDIEPDKVQDTINNLKATLDKSKKIPESETKTLVNKLNELYGVKTVKEDGKEVKKFSQKERYNEVATSIVQQKFAKLNDNDPFLITEEKFKKMKEETDYSGDHPVLKEIGEYNAKYKPSDAITNNLGIQKKIVSFGKLFSVFMGEALLSINSIDEFQMYFYCLNDKCGPVSYTNIAEFPIDVPVFLSQYKEAIQNKGSETMTIEEFIQLVINAQFSDQRAPGYGLLSQGIFEPYDPKNTGAKLIKDGQKKLDEAILKMGSFVLPQIEVFVETTHEKLSQKEPVDLLRFYESPGSIAGNSDPVGQKLVRKICRIHVYDKTVNPYKGATYMLRSGGAAQGNDTTYIEIEGAGAEQWIREHEKETADSVKAVYDQEVQFKTNALVNEKSVTLNANKVSSNEDIKRLVSKLVPSIIVGMNATGVYEATLASKQDPMLSAAQLLGHNAGKKPAGLPSGGAVGGLPLRVIPAALTLRTIGCPLLNYSQMFFVDFGTGTTLDNVYGISGLTHTISPGKFDSAWTMAFYDAYGKYESAQVKLAGMVPAVEKDNQEDKKDQKTKPKGK